MESVTEFKNQFVWNKSKPLPDSLNPMNYRVDLNEVTKIRYHEEWRLHKKNPIIDKRILAITLIRDSYTNQGEYRGTGPLFYIFYDKEFMAKYEQMSINTSHFNSRRIFQIWFSIFHLELTRT